MTPSGLLKNLRALGVELTTDGTRLHWRAPQGALTPDLMQGIREHKPSLISLLVSEPDQPPPALADVAPDTDEHAPSLNAMGLNTPPRRVWVRSRLPGLEGETILCVETEADIPPGHTGPAFTLEELRRMVDLDPAAVAAVYQSKATFSGRYVGKTPSPDAGARFHPPPREDPEAGTVTLAMFEGKGAAHALR